MDNKRFAVLIDAENISASYVEDVLNEIAEYGVATYKRMYGDFTRNDLKAWNNKAIEHSIVQIQQPRYSQAKNAADIMLVIDAMDILHTGNVEGFCIVSSDSDFTRLVNRLSEGGMEVIGIGKKDASRSLKAACTEYKNIEVLSVKENEEDEIESNNTTNSKNVKVPETKEEDSDILDIKEVKKAIVDIILRKEAKGKTTGLGEIGSQLVKTYPDFDIRNYGYKSLTTFIDDMKEFNILRIGNSTTVALSAHKVDKNQVQEFIVQEVKKGSIELGLLGQKV